jgi:lysophospholipase L1-like esterase
LVSANRHWTEVNFGRGGTGYLTSAGPLSCGRPSCPDYLDALPALTAVSPDVVVVAGGQNDLATYNEDPAAGAAKIRLTYATIRKMFPNALIVAVGPSSPVWPVDPFRGLDESVREAAHEAGAEYINLLDPPVFDPGSVLADGAHVGDAGHRAIATRVEEMLAQSAGPAK